MGPPYRFASVDDDDGSDEFEMAYTPPGSDENVSPESTKAVSASESDYMYELLNMFGIEDSYPNARVSREDAAQYANLLQDTINAFDAALDDPSVSHHRRQLLQNYRDNMYHRCREAKDCAVVPAEFVEYLDDNVNLALPNTRTPTTDSDAVGGAVEELVIEKKDPGPNTTYTVATEQQKQRSDEELIEVNFMSLSREDKARVLIPLLQELKSVNEKPSSARGSESPFVDQVDTIQNMVEDMSLKLPSFDQVREHMGIHKDNHPLGEPSTSVHQPKLSQLGHPPRALSLAELPDDNSHAIKHDDYEVSTSHGFSEFAQELEATQLQPAHGEQLETAIDALRTALTTLDGGSPLAYQRAYEKYSRLLPKVDKADDIDTASTSWKEMEQFKVIATVDDATLEQITKHKWLVPLPEPATFNVTNVDKFIELTQGQFFRPEVVATLAMCRGRYSIAEAIYNKGGVNYVKQLLRTWISSLSHANNGLHVLEVAHGDATPGPFFETNVCCGCWGGCDDCCPVQETDSEEKPQSRNRCQLTYTCDTCGTSSLFRNVAGYFICPHCGLLPDTQVMHQEHTEKAARKDSAKSAEPPKSANDISSSGWADPADLVNLSFVSGDSAPTDRLARMLCAAQSGGNISYKPSLNSTCRDLSRVNCIWDLSELGPSFDSEQIHERVPMSIGSSKTVQTDKDCHWTEEQDQDLLYFRTTWPSLTWQLIAADIGMSVAQCKERFEIIRPKTLTSKATSEEEKDPEPKMNIAEKKLKKIAKEGKEDAQQKQKIHVQSKVNTGWFTATPGPPPTKDGVALYGGGGWDSMDYKSPWPVAEEVREAAALSWGTDNHRKSPTLTPPPKEGDHTEVIETNNGYHWKEDQDEELVSLRHSKPKCSWPKIAKRLNAPVDLCKERYQLTKPRGSANKASKKEQKARKAEKASKIRSYDMREGTSEPEIDFELEFDADMARSVTPKSNKLGDDYGRNKIHHQKAEQFGLGGGGETGGFDGAWGDTVDPNKRSAPAGDGGWGSAPRVDIEYDGWYCAAPAWGPPSDNGGPADAWGDCDPGGFYSPDPVNHGGSTEQKKNEPWTPAPASYTITYWATVECGDQIVHIPVDSSNVAGPEKTILDGPAKKVWKWVQEKGLADKIGLQDAFDLAKDMNGADAVEEEEGRSYTPRSRASSFCRTARDRTLDGDEITCWDRGWNRQSCKCD